MECSFRLERGRWTSARLLSAGTATRTGSSTRAEEEEAGKEERQAAAAHARKAREKDVARSKHQADSERLHHGTRGHEE